MKKLILAFAFLFIASSVLAQSGTLTAPIVPPTQTSLIVGQVHELRADPNDATTAAKTSIAVWTLDSTGARAAVTVVNLTTNADISGFLAAVETPFPGEVAGTTLAARARRHNGRILNYLLTNCATLTPSCGLPASTLVP
jgi:hypothetical protein